MLRLLCSRAWSRTLCWRLSLAQRTPGCCRRGLSPHGAAPAPVETLHGTRRAHSPAPSPSEGSCSPSFPLPSSPSELQPHRNTRLRSINSRVACQVHSLTSRIAHAKPQVFYETFPVMKTFLWGFFFSFPSSSPLLLLLLLPGGWCPSQKNERTVQGEPSTGARGEVGDASAWCPCLVPCSTCTDTVGWWQLQHPALWSHAEAGFQTFWVFCKEIRQAQRFPWQGICRQEATSHRR